MVLLKCIFIIFLRSFGLETGQHSRCSISLKLIDRITSEVRSNSDWRIDLESRQVTRNRCLRKRLTGYFDGSRTSPIERISVFPELLIEKVQ